MISKRVCVIGGGAAGLMAAIHAARYGAEVTVFERNDRLGKQLRITGKGRCNVTNHCTRDEFFANIPATFIGYGDSFYIPNFKIDFDQNDHDHFDHYP